MCVFAVPGLMNSLAAISRFESPAMTSLSPSSSSMLGHGSTVLPPLLCDISGEDCENRCAQGVFIKAHMDSDLIIV